METFQYSKKCKLVLKNQQKCLKIITVKLLSPSFTYLFVTPSQHFPGYKRPMSDQFQVSFLNS